MRNKSGLLVCLAVLLCMTPLSAMCPQETSEETTTGEFSCLKETTLKVANRDQIITLHDAERIKLTVENYLAKTKPKLSRSVPGPGEAFIDCRSTVRMGARIHRQESTSEVVCSVELGNNPQALEPLKSATVITEVGTNAVSLIITEPSAVARDAGGSEH